MGRLLVANFIFEHVLRVGECCCCHHHSPAAATSATQPQLSLPQPLSLSCRCLINSPPPPPLSSAAATSATQPQLSFKKTSLEVAPGRAIQFGDLTVPQALRAVTEAERQGPQDDGMGPAAAPFLNRLYVNFRCKNLKTIRKSTIS